MTGGRIAAGAIALAAVCLIGQAFWWPGAVPRSASSPVQARAASEDLVPAASPLAARTGQAVMHRARREPAIVAPGVTDTGTVGAPANGGDKTADQSTAAAAASAVPGVTHAAPASAVVPEFQASQFPANVQSRTIILPKETVIGIRLDQAISSQTARTGDKVTARVSRNVVADDVTAIPVGTRLEGTIEQVDRNAPGRRGRVGLRFTMLVRADGTRVAIETDAIFREGDPINRSAPALSVRSGFGAVLANRGQPVFDRETSGSRSPGPEAYRDARLPAGSLLTVQLTAPVSVPIGRSPQ